MRSFTAGLLGAVCLSLLAMPCARADGAVAQVTRMVGAATRTARDGSRDALADGGALAAGDRIETGARAMVALEFSDSTRFVLGAETSFRVDAVDAGAGVFSAAVLKGAFRFVTGLIARQHPRAMQVWTGQVATIGIRGTTVGGEVIGDSATIVLLPSEDGATFQAIEVGNPHGQVVIDQPGYGTRVPDAASPPSPPQRMSLRAIDNLVRTLNRLQRIAVPRPLMR